MFCHYKIQTKRVKSLYDLVLLCVICWTQFGAETCVRKRCDAKWRPMYHNWLTRRFVILFTGACHCFISWARLIQSPHLGHLLRYLTFHLRQVLPDFLLTSVFTLRFCVHFSHACYMYVPLHPSWFDHSVNSANFGVPFNVIFSGLLILFDSPHRPVLRRPQVFSARNARMHGNALEPEGLGESCWLLIK